MLLHTCARLEMLGLGVGFAVLLSLSSMAEPKCTQVCNLALASYYIQSGQSLSEISGYLKASISEIHSYNPQIPNPDSIQSDTRINVPFSCGCVNDSFLGHIIKYQIQKGDTYDKVAKFHYSNLTTASWIQSFNSYPVTNIPEGATINVMVNCSCGNASVSNAYGLFVTYPLRPGESLSSIAQQMNLSQSLLRSYNPTADFSAGTGLVYIPGKGKNETYLPLGSGGNGRGSSGAGGVIAGVCLAVIAGLIILAAGGVYYMRRKKRKQALLLPDKPEYQLAQAVSTGQAGGGDVVSGITVDKSVEFFYEELAKATDNFSLANKIGQGGFGAVYYAELRGEKAAIKKMDMQASREFLAELKVLTRVHHLNLVRLIGYCTEGSLCLVYEFIDNGNLTQHLRGSGRDPLTWSARVQIALDSARGLEYIHEHTVPVYIHRDIKSANILIDQNFHAKVADFGLTKLAEVGNASMPTRLVGTFGYMPPEYAQFGDVSPKVDVYAFGVVLYELISAKEAVLKENGSVVESKGLVALFEDVFSNSDPNELCKLVDPRLGEDYPLDSVCKVAELGRACTQENPELRPSMRSIVVALMALSSTTESWNIGAFYDDHSLVNLMSGR